ncbi:MAG: PTS glucose transporter subunit IIA [Tissierellales bacterium]|jgi:PTS system glucose-specific IIA component|nr:PTS glucose transporter subunit IIA [Tissierellales bacterium]
MFKWLKKNNKCEIKSPIKGQFVLLENVPDPVFAQKMVGDGIAIELDENMVKAPIDGEVVNVFPTKHAIGIKNSDGVEMLIHVGLDTVELKGEGFECFVEAGDIISIGQNLLKVDLEYLKKNGKSLISPIIITNMGSFENLRVIQHESVNFGDLIIELEK